MTTIMNRPALGLLVVDVQKDVVAKAHRRDEVVENIRMLVERARRAKVPVVWVQHHDGDIERGSDGWRIVAELEPRAGEALVEKSHGDAFEGTNLEAVLQSQRVGRLFVVGAETDACIRSTLHGAFARGYDTLLVSDAHTTNDKSAWGAPLPEQVIAHTNLYWSYQTAPGKTAGKLKTEQVDFSAPATLQESP